MKEFLSYMKSTLLAAGLLCSARRALHCSKSFALLTTVSLALAVLCTACADNDSPFRSVIPDEDDEYIFAIKPLPIEGEEIPYGDSRALNPMSVDKENMIKKIAIFQYDAENNLRKLKDNGYFIYVDFSDKENSDNTTNHFTQADKGYTRVTEHELPALSSVLWTSTSSSLKTCVIANVPRSMVESALFPNGMNGLPADWAEFQKTSFDLPFLTEQDIENDKLVNGDKELGHLSDIYMFGYYEGTVPPMGFTLGLGRTVARLKVTFTVEDTKKIDPDARFYAAVSNLGRQSSYFIKMDANSEPNISEAYLLDPERFDLSTGEAVIQFYGGPKVNENINDRSEATTLLLWYVRPNDDGNYSTPDPTNDEWLGKAVKVPFGNAPKEGNYGVVRNTLYSFRLPLIFNSTGFGIEYMYSYTLRDVDDNDNKEPLPVEIKGWNKLYLYTEEIGEIKDKYIHIDNWDEANWLNKMVKVSYKLTDVSDLAEDQQYHSAQFAETSTWKNLPNNPNINLEAEEGTFDLILTKDVLDVVRANKGFYISGHGYKITKIEIWEEGYASATPIAGDFTFAIVNNNNGWDWEHRGYMDGTNEHPYALTLGSTNSKGSGFLISNLLNTSYDPARVAKYGVVDYVIYNDEKTFKLVDKPYAKRQVQFDFSQLTYDVKTGTNEISPDYIKIVPIDTDGDNNNDSYALLPLQPTTELSSGQDVIFYVSFPDDYDVGKKEGNKPESFTVTSRTVPVKVSIAGTFSHVLTPASDLGRIETSGTTIATFIGDKTFTATKAYQGEEINSVSGVSLSDLTLRSSDPVTDKNGDAITGVDITDGKINFPEGFSGTVYLHYNVATSVASTHALNTYQYFDLTLPIQLGPESLLNKVLWDDPENQKGEINWGGNVILIGAEKFTDANVGDKIKISYKDAYSGNEGKAMIALKTNADGWPQFQSFEVNNTEGYVEWTISSEDNLAKLQATGLVVCGRYFKCTEVRIYTPNSDPTPQVKSWVFTLFNTNDQGQWQDGKGQGNDALDKGTLSTEWNLTHLINYDHSTEAISAYGYTAHTIEHHPKDDTEWKKTEYVEFRKTGQKDNNANNQIEFDFNNISYTVENDGTYVKKDGNNILPLAAGDAIVNVTLAENQPSGYTIENRTVKVKFTIDGTKFEHTLEPQTQLSTTLPTGESYINSILQVNNSNIGFRVVKKYNDQIVHNTDYVYNRYNGISFQVSTTGNITYNSTSEQITVPSENANGSLSITFSFTNEDIKNQYKYPESTTYVHTIIVGSGSTPSNPTYEGTELWHDTPPVVMDSEGGNKIQLESSAFNNANIGDKVRVYITDVLNGAQMGLRENVNGWPEIATGLEYFNISSNDEYIDLPIDDSVLQKLQSTGLVITGKNYTVTHVSLIAGTGNNDPGNGTEIWSGPLNSAGWPGAQIGRNYFQNVNINDSLEIEATSNINYETKVELCVQTAPSNYKTLNTYNGYTGGNMSLKIEDETDLTRLKENGLFIRTNNANDITVTKITLIPASN